MRVIWLNSRSYTVVFAVITLGLAASVSSEPPGGKDVHEFMESHWDSYEQQYSVEKAEALVFIKASQHFKMGLLEIAREYHRIARRPTGLKITDAEQDVLSIKQFKSIGFKKRGNKWYYDGQEVTMGEQLDVPESMKKKDPKTGSALNAKIEIQKISKTVGTGTVNIVVETNLPDGMALMSDLKRDGAYQAQDSEVVSNGKATFEFQNLRLGQYQFTISSPTVSVQPDHVKRILGESGRNLTGTLVEFDPVWGKRVNFTSSFEIE